MRRGRFGRRVGVRHFTWSVSCVSLPGGGRDLVLTAPSQITTDILGPYGVGFAMGTLGWGPGIALYTVFGFMAGYSGYRKFKGCKPSLRHMTSPRNTG